MCEFSLHKTNKYVEEFLPTVLIMKKQIAVSNILCIRVFVKFSIAQYIRINIHNLKQNRKGTENTILGNIRSSTNVALKIICGLSERDKHLSLL